MMERKQQSIFEFLPSVGNLGFALKAFLTACTLLDPVLGKKETHFFYILSISCRKNGASGALVGPMWTRVMFALLCQTSIDLDLDGVWGRGPPGPTSMGWLAKACPDYQG